MPDVGQQCALVCHASVRDENHLTNLTGVAGQAQCQVQCLAEDDDSTQRRAAFDFHLSPEGADEGDVEYVPTDLSQACPEKLPGYMREPITFEKEQAPIFLSRLVKMMAEA